MENSLVFSDIDGDESLLYIACSCGHENIVKYFS